MDVESEIIYVHKKSYKMKAQNTLCEYSKSAISKRVFKGEMEKSIVELWMQQTQ